MKKNIPNDDYLTIRLYADIEFAEEISPEYADVSSWESIPLVVKGDPVNVDFNEFCASVDKKNRKIVHCEWRDPDFNTFEKGFQFITIEALKNKDIHLGDEGFDNTVIAERYAFGTYDDDLDIPQVGVTNAAIVSPYNEFEQYDLVVDGEWQNLEHDVDMLI